MGSLSGSINLEIPIINIAGYLDGDVEKTAQIAQELQSACQSPGFFQIIGHRVSTELRQQLFSRMVEFFALSSSSKQALNRSQSKCLRGYESVGQQKLEGGYSDQKEGFMIGHDLPTNKRFLQGPNQWPSENAVPGFKEAFTAYFDKLHGLSKMMFRLMALSLNLDEKYFDEFVGSNDCKLRSSSSASLLLELRGISEQAITMCRAHRYPPATPETAQQSRGIGAHTDYGALTLLMQDDSGFIKQISRQGLH